MYAWFDCHDAYNKSVNLNMISNSFIVIYIQIDLKPPCMIPSNP